MNYKNIKSSQMSYKLLSKLSLEGQEYWVKKISEKHISKRDSKNHINWLRRLVKKLEMSIMQEYTIKI